MSHFLIVLATFVVAVSALPAIKAIVSLQSRSGSGCSLSVNGGLGSPQPVYLQDNKYLEPTGTTGQILLDTGEQIIIACTGSGRAIQHPNIIATVATATVTCVSDTLISGDGWLDGVGDFSQLTCSSHPNHEAKLTSESCYNNNFVIKVGYTVNDQFYPLYSSCFDQTRLEAIYAWYEQNPPNSVFQANVERPSWLASTFYPGVAVNTMYTKAQQKLTIANLVGTELADKYVTGNLYLARGHLAAKTDFIFASGQRTTFYFINACPQWQPINAGNWDWLEQNLRSRVGDAGYNTVVYTGTYGVGQLRDENNRWVDIYLYQDDNNNSQIPVPLYNYKVIHDESRRIGTAFVVINNPYYMEEEVKDLQFCPDQCRNNTDFSWLNWEPDRIDIGYAFCCTIDDFRKKVPHLPTFTVDDLLT